MSYYIYANGSQQAQWINHPSSEAFSFTTALTAGQFVDFLVGVNTTSGYFYGNTPLSLTVTPATSSEFGAALKTSSSYTFTVQQGARATGSIQLTNADNVLHSANLTVLNPHSDLIVSIADPTVTLAAGETADISIDIDAASASLGTYNDLLIQITADDGSTLVANLTIYVVAAGTPSLPDLQLARTI